MVFGAGVRKLFLSLALVIAATTVSAAPLRIGKITVDALDVYADAEAAKGGVYRAANALHPETRDSVIRKFLLFREGDEYKPERLAESERNLRALHYLKSATVTALEPHDGVVDVVVITQDAWSIAPETQAGNKGGETTYGASLSDTNVLGLGKEMAVSWNKGVDRTRFGVDYQDAALNKDLWTTHIAYGHTSDGYDHRLQVRRPFFSFATPWAADISFQGYRLTDKTYEDGVAVSGFSQKHTQMILAYGRALGESDVVASRVTGGLRFTDDSFGPAEEFPDEAMPQRRSYRYLFARYEHADNDFLKLNFVNKDIRYEDFNLGMQYSAEFGLSPRAFGLDTTSTYGRVQASTGWRFGQHAFVLPSAAIESRFDGGPQNTIATAGLAFVLRGNSRYPTATVARIAYNAGWRTDPELQFYADGLTGLRAYRVYAFAGTRSLVMNLEQRMYLGREMLQLFSPGVVAFIDAGNAANPGSGNLSKLYTDVGVGLRVGLPRTPKNLIRVDFGYALRQDLRGNKGLMVTVSSGQAF